jgi:hypothetical protein
MSSEGPPVGRSIRRALCYNQDFMVQFFIAVWGALPVFLRARAGTALESLLSASDSPCSNANHRGHP